MLIDGFWFPAALGVLLGGSAWLTYGGHARPSALSLGLFMSAVLLVIGDAGATQMIQFATTADPLFKQEREANARFYLWGRSRWRYLAACVSGALVWLGAKVGLSGSEQRTVFFAGVVLYAAPFLFDLTRSLREARGLFPPSGAQ